MRNGVIYHKYDIINSLFKRKEIFYYMDILQLMRERHSVRQYKEKPVEESLREELNAYAADLNEKSGLDIQILYDEPKCFSSFTAKYGKFVNASNYVALIGEKGADLAEKSGYYGESFVLKAQELGLNSCWVALTHGKSAAVIKKGEKEACLIVFGYGENSGVPHKSKPLEQLCDYNGSMPNWFLTGMEAAMLAPTAVNGQKFYITLDGDAAKIKIGRGLYTRLDSGIVKYHFETASGHKLQR